MEEKVSIIQELDTMINYKNNVLETIIAKIKELVDVYQPNFDSAEVEFELCELNLDYNQLDKNLVIGDHILHRDDRLYKITINNVIKVDISIDDINLVSSHPIYQSKEIDLDDINKTVKLQMTVLKNLLKWCCIIT